MEVILLKDIKGVGKTGEIVKVKEGYAKNFLFPQKAGILATPEELQKIANKKKREEKEHEKTIEAAKETAKKLEEKVITVKVKTGDNGKIFGSVTSKEVADIIEKESKIAIDKKKVTLSEEHIKTTGNYTATVKIYQDVKAVVKLNVEGA